MDRNADTADGDCRKIQPSASPHQCVAGWNCYCPLCGKRLSVMSKSDRWTHGKPRFKHTYPGVRKKKCTFKAVDGVLLDEFVVAQLSNLSDESAVYYNTIFN